jgi:fringe protein
MMVMNIIISYLLFKSGAAFITNGPFAKSRQWLDVRNSVSNNIESDNSNRNQNSGLVSSVYANVKSSGITKADDEDNAARSIDNDINNNLDNGHDFDSMIQTWEAEVLSTVFIGVTTTGRYHRSRLGPVLETWYPGLAAHTWFFTDTADPALTAGLAGEDHLVVLPHCGSDHSRAALACKMEAQLAAFLESLESPPGGQRWAWFCHLDDDNYLNGRTLAALLARFNGHTEDWYLGKASIPEPLELPSAGPPARRFWFATGGAGFCLSRHLAERMRPWVLAGRFRQLSDSIRLPDDVTVGYLVEVLLGGHLTPVAALHSHLERLEGLGPLDLEAAITLSYGRFEDTGEDNVVGWGKEEDWKEDRTRFYAVHCRLRPEECKNPAGWLEEDRTKRRK